MKRPAKKKAVGRNLSTAAGAAALLATLSSLTGKATTAAAHAPLRAVEGAAVHNAPPPPQQARADPARSDSSLMREAHADGGYWYWLEHEGPREDSH